MECDATNVVQGVKTNVVGLSPFHQFIDAISIATKSFSHFNISHVSRAGYTLAYLVARFDSCNYKEFVCFGPFPQSLVTLAGLDLI